VFEAMNENNEESPARLLDVWRNSRELRPAKSSTPSSTPPPPPRPRRAKRRHDAVALKILT